MSLTLDHIARFAKSSSAPVYLSVCERFGLDPAADIEDDFLAHQLRVALLVAAQLEPEQVEKPSVFETHDIVQRKLKAAGH